MIRAFLKAKAKTKTAPCSWNLLMSELKKIATSTGRGLEEQLELQARANRWPYGITLKNYEQFGPQAHIASDPPSHRA